MNENEIRKIAAEIEARYIELSDDDWYKIVQVLVKRADV